MRLKNFIIKLNFINGLQYGYTIKRGHLIRILHYSHGLLHGDMIEIHPCGESEPTCVRYPRGKSNPAYIRYICSYRWGAVVGYLKWYYPNGLIKYNHEYRMRHLYNDDVGYIWDVGGYAITEYHDCRSITMFPRYCL